MNRYRTSEIAKIIGIHPNTVRLYEELELIPKPDRMPNGYRVFTDLHIEQFRLARLAFQVEVLQNGLRKKIVQMIKYPLQVIMTKHWNSQRGIGCSFGRKLPTRRRPLIL